MPEIVGLVSVENESVSTDTAALNASSSMEEFAHENMSPYFPVVPATEETPNLDAAGVLTDVDYDEETVMMYEYGTDDADAILTEFLDLTHNLAQRELSTLLRNAEALAEDEYTPITKTVEQDAGVVEALLNRDKFVYAAAEIGDRFGSPYRVWDLTHWAHGSPVRSREQAEEVAEYFEGSDRETLYVVKFLASGE